LTNPKRSFLSSIFKIKCGCEGIEVRNNVSYVKFLNFENNFELKIWEIQGLFLTLGNYAK
jgi:hypothetical protein